MMTPNGAAGIRDAIIAGSARLRLPMTDSMLSLMRCSDAYPCKQGRCPVCTSTEAQRLRRHFQTPILRQHQWTRRAYSLESHVRALNDYRPIDVNKIESAINKTLDEYVASCIRQDHPEIKSYGCTAEFGLVEDTSIANRGRTVVVVEFVLTGANENTDYEVMFEGLHYNFGVDVYGPHSGPLQVKQVPIVSTNAYGVLPDQGLLFGYTRRRLDAPERPTIVANKKRLAQIASNYGEHPVSRRSFSRGLSFDETGMIFERNPLFFL